MIAVLKTLSSAATVAWASNRPGQKAPLAFPARRPLPSHFRHARPVLPPSPGPAPARDRSSPRLCRPGQQVTLGQGLGQPCRGTTLCGHHPVGPGFPRTPSGYTCCIYVAPPAELPVATAESTLPDARMQVLKAVWRMCACITLQPILHVSLLLVDSLGSLSFFWFPPAFIVGTSLQLPS